MQDLLDYINACETAEYECSTQYRPGASIRVSIEKNYSGVDLTEDLGL